MALVKVSEPVKSRLDAMRDGMAAGLGRPVTLNAVLEALLAEHDRNAREEAGA